MKYRAGADDIAAALQRVSGYSLNPHPDGVKMTVYRHRHTHTCSSAAKVTNACTSGSFLATSMNSLRACLKSFACSAHALALYLHRLL